MNKIKFGAKVSCKQKLIRYQERAKDGNFPNRYLKGWRRGKCINSIKQKQFNGLFIGYRTVQEGYTEINGEYGPFFVPVNYKKVALVVKDENTNPVYVHLEDIQEIEND